MLLCQRWNNVDKCTLAQLSFSTKNQRGVCWAAFVEYSFHVLSWKQSILDFPSKIETSNLLIHQENILEVKLRLITLAVLQ